MSSCPVKCWNEWDPLEEVIVGYADDSCEPSMHSDPVWHYLFSKDELKLAKPGPCPKDMIDQANAELENLARVLANEGAVVRRPTPMKFSQSFGGDKFSCPTGYNCTCPRDILTCVGDQVIEAPMGMRCRFFEYGCYRPLIQEYWEKGADWVAAPKGTMDDQLYDSPNYPHDKYSPERKEAIKNRKYITTEYEPIWDAADLMRCGKDILAQRSWVTNEKGIEWAKRHFKKSFGLRTHALHSEDLLPKHLDCSLVPLRPGLFFENPERKMDERGMFLENGWEIVQSKQPDGRDDEFTGTYMRCTSSWIGMNVMNVDEKTVVASAHEKDIVNQLESLGFRVLQVPFKCMYYLGGGFHCATTDVRRRGELQSYFPKLDEAEAKAEDQSKYTNKIGN